MSRRAHLANLARGLSRPFAAPRERAPRGASSFASASASASASEAASGKRFAVVGSGPAGMYAALALTKTFQGSRVDVFERYPTPFGLVRFGVAPDHAETKLVTNKFNETLTTRDDVRFFGNVQLGRDVALGELCDGYHGVVLACGTSGDRKLEVPGEDAYRGVLSAREFVAWFNGDPEHGIESETHAAVVEALGSSMREDARRTAAHVAVIGVGNVAIDCARILLRDKDALAKTDICEHALEVLRKHPVDNVSVIGRRGPAQASFSPKELRELLNLPDVRVVIPEEEFALAPEDEAELAENRPRRRAYEAMTKRLAAENPETNKTLTFRFLSSPLGFEGTEDGVLQSMKLGRNELVGRAGSRKSISSGETEDIPTVMALRSVGYRAEEIKMDVEDTSVSKLQLPFDQVRRVVPNEYGAVKISAEADECVPGLYVTGWLKRGPTGIIGTNLTCAEETVAKMASDFTSNPPAERKLLDVESILARRGVRVVTGADWHKLDERERERGASVGKPRSKFTSIGEMLKALDH
jgi:adrenodoxin-NADP+ reductase